MNRIRTHLPQRCVTLAVALTSILPTAAVAQPFVDVTQAKGLVHTHSSTPPMDEVEIMNEFAEIMSSWITGGVAVGDYDGDSHVDLFVLGGNNGTSRLFRNRGDGTFEDVAAAVGVEIVGERSTGAVFVDYDGDRDLDLWVGGALSTPPRLFKNESPGELSTILVTTFTNVFATAFTGFDLDRAPNSWGGAFGDYDLDGDLDLFIPHSMTPSGPELDPVDGSTQHLWRNNGDGTFTDVSDEAGITELFDETAPGESTKDQTFSPNFADINEDGWPDLVISGDIGTSRVLLNQQDGTFLNTTDPMVINGNTAMGTAVGDYDNDGHLDWFVSHIRFADPQSGNRLYRGLGDGSFEEVTEEAGVRDGHWGWGACFGDFDNDRHLDIFHVNGFYYQSNPFSEDGSFTDNPAVMFHSNGDGTFTELAALVGIADIGEGRGVSCFDYDRDGDLDIAISNHNGPFRLYENTVGNSLGGFLDVTLRGRKPNTQGIGARIEVSSVNVLEAGILTHEVRAGSNFQSANLAAAHFGLGDWQGPFWVSVTWPNGLVSKYRAELNEFLTLRER